MSQDATVDYAPAVIQTAPNGDTAEFSECGRYRYALTRHLGDMFQQPPYRTVNFIMLNPSTADAFMPDPTITRCIQFAKAWGFDRLRVCNLFAFRATDPKVMLAADDPVGPLNQIYLEVDALFTQLIVCAWGNGGTYRGRGKQVLARLFANRHRPHCLKLTGAGQPYHPLYLKRDLKPFPMENPCG